MTIAAACSRTHASSEPLSSGRATSPVIHPGTDAFSRRGRFCPRRALARQGRTMDTLLKDLRYAQRTLRRRPVFTIVAVLSLALGIGANSAIFSVVNGVLFKPLEGVHDEERLARVYMELSSFDWPLGLSVPNFRDMRAGTEEHFSAVGGHTLMFFGTSVDGEVPQITYGNLVYGDYFATLGATPAQGRYFGEREGAAREPVVVVSHAFWQSRLGGDAQVIGRQLTIDGQAFTVIGVAPAGFFGVEVIFAPELWVPFESLDRFSAMAEERGSRQLESHGAAAPRRDARPGIGRPRCSDGGARAASRERRRVVPRHADLGGARRSGSWRAASHVGDHTHGARGAGPADRLRQRRQPDDGARGRAPPRAQPARRHWRWPRTAGAPADDREPALDRGRRCPGAGGSVHDHVADGVLDDARQHAAAHRVLAGSACLRFHRGGGSRRRLPVRAATGDASVAHSSDAGGCARRRWVPRDAPNCAAAARW